MDLIAQWVYMYYIYIYIYMVSNNRLIYASDWCVSDIVWHFAFCPYWHFTLCPYSLSGSLTDLVWHLLPPCLPTQARRPRCADLTSTTPRSTRGSPTPSRWCLTRRTRAGSRPSPSLSPTPQRPRRSPFTRRRRYPPSRQPRTPPSSPSRPPHPKTPPPIWAVRAGRTTRRQEFLIVTTWTITNPSSPRRRAVG